MVSFKPKLRTTVEKQRDSGEVVAVTNCSVQESKKEGFDGMKIVAGMQMTVLKLPQKFSIHDLRGEASSLFVCWKYWRLKEYMGLLSISV